MNTKMKISKKVYALFTTSVMMLISSSMYCQTYSKEEQGLIDHVTNCWDAWMEGVEKNDPQIWYEKCPSKPDASMWWTQDGAPQPIDWVQRNWDIVSAVDSKWVDMRPVTIRIWDDVGMVQFYGYWQALTKKEYVVTEFKRTEMFKNENGNWILLGGQGTPVAQKDADPY